MPQVINFSKATSLTVMIILIGAQQPSCKTQVWLNDWSTCKVQERYHLSAMEAVRLRARWQRERNTWLVVSQKLLLRIWKAQQHMTERLHQLSSTETPEHRHTAQHFIWFILRLVFGEKMAQHVQIMVRKTTACNAELSVELNRSVQR